MNAESNERFKQFYLQIEAQFNVIKDVFERCQDIKREWKLEIDDIDELQDYFDRTTNKINDFKTKLYRDKKKIIVFGETSSGKSTFINSLLKRNLLKMTVGRTTGCPIKIQYTPVDEEYIIVNGQRKSIIELHLLTTYNQNRSIEGFVNVFINLINSDLQLKMLEIVDTSGINEKINIDDIVKNECIDADIIILLVSCTSTINMTIKKFCEQLHDAFAHITVFIIYNRSEEIDDDEEQRINYYNDAKNLLSEIFEYTTEQIRNKIFFISAIEQLNNESNVSSDKTRLRRNGEFENMKHQLTVELQMSLFKRKCLHINGLFSLVEESLSKVKGTVAKIESLLKSNKQTNDNNLVNISDSNKEINKKISEFFDKHYERFLKESIKQFNENWSNENVIKEIFGENCIKFRNEIKNKLDENLPNIRSSEIYTQDYSNNLMMRYDSREELVLSEYTYEELNQSDNDEDLEDMRNILEQFYSELIDERFDEFKNNTCKENFKEINKIINNGKIGTAGAVVGLGVVGAITGGIAIGVLAAVELAGAVVAGIVGGTAVIGATTTGIVQNIKDPFRHFWRHEERPIKDNWENFKTDLIRKFDEFLERFCNLIGSIRTMENELIRVGNELEIIRNDFNSFRMESKIND